MFTRFTVLLLTCSVAALAGCASDSSGRQVTTPSTSMTAPPASAATSVTGAWTGWVGEGTKEEPVTMNLKQTGANVSGDLIIGGRPDLSGPLTGSVQGNAMRDADQRLLHSAGADRETGPDLRGRRRAPAERQAGEVGAAPRPEKRRQF
jgi:hypothetical protein